jgi:hypothetical protein
MNSFSYLHPRAPEITPQISPPDCPLSPMGIFDYGLWEGHIPYFGKLKEK